ncbi:MAG: DNA cytosine methyltransferase [Proteobacteria bacterium]|nr:DNA cytosine methyltransferase [Pseudomonadota bacterium]MBU1585518.1 DNA cytosine methyltransferase [Pseudomonadota bacterium]MBU2455005.1 DNA cytosine methyltransferase [Pseudomonadota bacterium]
MIPIIDIFAGPGGLGEGFSSLRCQNELPVFGIALSIEKDTYAHSTLELRSFFRKFPCGKAPEEYYEYIRKKSLINSPGEHRKLRSRLFEKYPDEAQQAHQEAWHMELGNDKDLNIKIDNRIREIIGAPGIKCWGMIGGPPCQAYSVIGRSRNKGIIGYSAENDKRSYLYQQYLRLIAQHKPNFFIMENVKGMLSAKLNGKSVFEKILDDLKFPRKAIKDKRRGKTIEYQIYPLIYNSSNLTKPEDFIVETEYYGIPQARHRVVLLGIRKDFSTFLPATLKKRKQVVTVKEVLGNLPELRSGLSREIKENNTLGLWVARLREIVDLEWFEKGSDKELIVSIKKTVEKISQKSQTQGSEYMPYSTEFFADKEMAAWYIDERLKGVCNHTSRSHMVSDLHRYLFASSFAEKYGRAPLIAEFPDELIPAHKNVNTGYFNDRFRVQIADKPSTTVTSHISKDGHYFIHYDPLQCRSLTVREAARLQTFPDNYYFEGSRTQQYTQVGNAVPPFLARQIAEVVHDLIKRTITGI